MNNYQIKVKSVEIHKVSDKLAQVKQVVRICAPVQYAFCEHRDSYALPHGLPMPYDLAVIKANELKELHKLKVVIDYVELCGMVYFDKNQQKQVAL